MWQLLIFSMCLAYEKAAGMMKCSWSVGCRDKGRPQPGPGQEAQPGQEHNMRSVTIFAWGEDAESHFRNRNDINNVGFTKYDYGDWKLTWPQAQPLHLSLECFRRPLNGPSTLRTPSRCCDVHRLTTPSSPWAVSVADNNSDHFFLSLALDTY